MTAGDGPWQGAATAALSWDAGDSPHSDQFGDLYYSPKDGLAESCHVFLTGNGLPGRWQDLDSQTFTIAETGFGTGLNFLATWNLWRRSDMENKRLHYISIEKSPLEEAALRRALAAWPALAELSDQLLRDYPPPLPGCHRLLFDAGRVCLDLVIEDVAVALTGLQEVQNLSVDAWYLDGFAPTRNPEMWTGAIFRAMAQLSHGGTVFSTFTAAGDVRRGLQEAGFAVEKIPGFDRKREMLRGEFTGEQAPPDYKSTPWHIAATPVVAERTALVLGAGLAGAGVAAALAERGWAVRVLDKGPLAGAASGNPQGILYTRISHRQSELNDFSLHSYCFALRLYRQLFASGALDASTAGELCGALHLLPEWTADHRLSDTVNSLPGLLYPVDAAEAAKLTGLPGCPGGLFYPGAGWIHPPALCRALLDHAAITLSENCGEVTLVREDSHWVAVADGSELARAEVAIVASGTASRKQPGLAWLPLQSIRGQITQVPSCGELAGLKAVICHRGYLAPARQDQHCIGATFDLDTDDSSVREADHDSNLAELEQALPQLSTSLAAIDRGELAGRVGFRCTSPDYLPLVGPVPARDSFCEDYAGLRKNARHPIAKTGSYMPGLYVSTAHGSRGLTSTPLASELLAAQINGEAWPVGAALYRALAPARFLVRDLIRNRI